MWLCTLRQTTLLIAIVDLLLSGIFLFLLLLGSAHAKDVFNMLEADMVDVERQEETEVLRINNENRMNDGQHLAKATIVMMYAGISFVTVHLICSFSAVVGTILSVRQLLLPWVTLVLAELILGGILLVSGLWLGYAYESSAIYIMLAFSLQLYICLWAIVWSFYRKLCHESLCHLDSSLEANTKVTTNKIEYISFPSKKPQHV